MSMGSWKAEHQVRHTRRPNHIGLHLWVVQRTRIEPLSLDTKDVTLEQPLARMFKI